MLRLMMVLIMLLPTACAFVPSQHLASDSHCQLSRPKMTLDMTVAHNNVCSNVNNDEAAAACLAVYGVIVPIGSLVISGSIVIANNTLRWIEYQGSCDSDTLDHELDEFNRDRQSS